MTPTLKPYQQTGVDHLLAALDERSSVDRVRLLLDEPGLGKTVSGAAALARCPAWREDSTRPTIVVCPSSVRDVWRRELGCWAPGLYPILPADVASIRRPGPGEVLIIGHDALGACRSPKPPQGVRARSTAGQEAHAKALALHARRVAAIASLADVLPGTILIVDEGQYAKGAGTARSLELEKLWKEAVRPAGGSLWILTGTIDPCSPLDFWVVLDVAGIARRIWPDGLVEFAAHFGGRYDTRERRWTFAAIPPGGSVLQGEVGRRLARYALRRRQEDVLGELPSPRALVTLCPIADDDGSIYALGDALLRAAVSCSGADPDRNPGGVLDALTGRRFGRGGNVDPGLVSQLRQKLAVAKIPAMLTRLAELEALGIGRDGTDPVVVYSEHRAPIEALRDRAGWGFITGEESQEQRARVVAGLAAGKLRGVGLTGAGRTGITLVQSRYMLKVSASWSADDEEQVERRLLRYGQLREVTVEVLLAAGHPVERMVLTVLSTKAARGAATWAPPAQVPVDCSAE